jgi:hypothetical protein
MSVARKTHRNPRHATHHDAWIALDGGFAKRKCTVLNLSKGGARIRVDDAGTVPGRLDLAFSKDVGKITRCRVVWRDRSSIGVAFLSAG